MPPASADSLSDVPSAPPKSFARFVPAILRILLGFPLVIFGLNGFFNFIKPPADLVMPEKAIKFSTALMESGYMMPLIGATLLVSGLLLLANRFVPLALLLLAPFFVNSILFHACLERSGLPMAVVFTVLMLALAWIHRAAYRPLFISRLG